MKRISLIAASCLLLVSACSGRAWYEGIQHSQRFDCFNLPPAQQEDCLQQLKQIDYQRYREELDKLKQRPQSQ